MSKKPITSDLFTNFKNKFKGGAPIIGETEFQTFKYSVKERAKDSSSSDIKSLGTETGQGAKELKIDYGLSEAEQDDIIYQKAMARVEAEAAAVAAEKERQKKIKKNLLTEAEIQGLVTKSRKNKKPIRVKTRGGKYYFTASGLDLSPIKTLTKAQINDKKYEAAGAIENEVSDILNTYNEAAQQGIAVIEGKGKRRKIKITDKEKFVKLINDRNKEDPPKTKKKKKPSEESTENKISNK